MCLSNGLERMGSKEIGRRFCGSDVSLVLGIGMTLASFKFFGNILFCKQRLYAYVNGSAIKGRASFINLIGKFSGPGEELY